MLTTEEAARIRDEALTAAMAAHDTARFRADEEFDFAVARLRRIRDEAHKLAARDYRTAANAAWSAYADAAAEEAAEIGAMEQHRHDRDEWNSDYANRRNPKL